MNFSQLMGLASGHVEARIVQSAVQLKIFDSLEAAPRSAEAVAAALQLDRPATELLLNALVALGLMQKNAETYALAEISREHLLRSSPRYVGAMILFDAALWSCWEKLPDALRSGKAVRPANMYQEDRAETETFIDGMDALVKARGDAEYLADALDWSKVNSVLDVGSGPATYPIALCRRFAHLHATVFDLPATLEITKRNVGSVGMDERIELVAGDYRSDDIPGRYDVIFLSNIIHGENYQKNQALIAKLARCLNPSGRIVIKDHILADNRTEPPVGAIFSLLMLLTTDGGRCYSFTEIAAWMNNAGLPQVHRIDFPAPLTSSLVVGAH
ncbi:MAG: methyltransferase domain-containing protein [Deltaproteobacteria bacterium]|nr:methyltransferase domain-containing protein [Deltaproteobacteria bacterium]